MSDKRFQVIDDGFSKWIIDTTLKEDRHEGNIYTAYDMCCKLNELYEENEQLRKELDSFKPVMFQDMRKGTIILYVKGDIDE